MPPVVAGVVAAASAAFSAVSAAAIAVGGAIATAAGAIGISASTLIGLGLSIGVSLIQGLLRGNQRPKTTVPESVTQTVRQSIGARRKIYGRMRAGGQVLIQRQEQNTGVVNGSNDNTMFLVLAVCDGESDQLDEFYIDGIEVNVDSNGLTTSGEASGSARFQTKLGTDNQTVFSDLASSFDNIDETWRGLGTTLLMFNAAANTQNSFELFPNGFRTQPSVVGNFRKVPDPRGLGQGKSYSANAARVIYDHITGSELENGLRYPADQIDIASFEAATDFAETQVAGPLDTVRARWELHGAVDYVEDRPIDALNRMLQSCNGQLTFNREGKLGLDLGEWYEPTVTITDDAILSIERDSGQFDSERATVVKANYLSPPHGYISQEAVEYEHPNKQAFGRKVKSVDYPMSANHGQTRHLQKIEAARLNAARRLTVTANVLVLNVLAERYVRIHSATANINATFEVQPDPEELITENGDLFGVRFSCVQLTQSDVEYDELINGAPPPPVPDQPVNTAKPVTPTLTAQIQAGAVVLSISNTSTANQHIVRYRRRIETEVDDGEGGTTTEITYEPYSAASFGDGSTTLSVSGLMSGEIYEFETQAISSGGRRSTYSSPPVEITAP